MNNPKYLSDSSIPEVESLNGDDLVPVSTVGESPLKKFRINKIIQFLTSIFQSRNARLDSLTTLPNPDSSSSVVINPDNTVSFVTKADLVNGQVPASQSRGSKLDDGIPDLFLSFTDARGTVTNISKISNSKIADNADIEWTKISKNGASPSDIGAASINHNHSWVTITEVPTSLIDISNLTPSPQNVIVGNGQNFTTLNLPTFIRNTLDNGTGILYNSATGVFSLDVAFVNSLIENYINPPQSTYSLTIENGFNLSIENNQNLLLS